MVNVVTLTWLTVGACIVYLVAQDSSVYTFLVLLSKNANIWLKRQWFLIRYNPDSPLVRWEVERNSRKLADELIKETQKK